MKTVWSAKSIHELVVQCIRSGLTGASNIQGRIGGKNGAAAAKAYKSYVTNGLFKELTPRLSFQDGIFALTEERTKKKKKKKHSAPEALSDDMRSEGQEGGMGEGIRRVVFHRRNGHSQLVEVDSEVADADEWVDSPEGLEDEADAGRKSALQILRLLPNEKEVIDMIEHNDYTVGEVVDVVVDNQRRLQVRMADRKYLRYDVPTEEDEFVELLLRIAEVVTLDERQELMPGRELVHASAEVLRLCSSDHRIGIDRQLHRICPIVNGDIVDGVTLRVGRHAGSAAFAIQDFIEDLIPSTGMSTATNKSMLMIGRPGSGKTTILREAARQLSLEHSVVIVDTSDEIAGVGKRPHEAIGNSRRMRVPNRKEQHTILIEAVSNHTPAAIVVDEIQTRAEAAAAVTISQRGVSMVATAHGTSLFSVLENPELHCMLGRFQVVTVGDSVAGKGKKSRKELVGSCPFDVVVEILDRSTFRIYPSAEEAVVAVQNGEPCKSLVRWVSDGQVLQREEFVDLE